MSEANPDRSRDYKRQLRLGDFRVDPGALVVQAGDQAIRLKPKAMAVLLELARQPGITVTREELLDRVWGNTFITPGVVGHAITALRRAFGDTLERPAYIETIPRIGYRLIATVEALDPPGNATGDAVGASPLAADISESGPASPQTANDAARLRRRPLLLAAIALAGIGAFVLLRWQTRQTSDERAPTERALTVADVRRITFATGSENNPRLNAAGDWLVYTRAAQLGAKPELFLQSVYGTQANPLAEGDHAERPAWSPDGRRIAYVWRDKDQCEIRIANVDDDSRQTVQRCPKGSIVYLDWNPADAKIIAYSVMEPGENGRRLQLLIEQGGWRPKAFDYQRTGNGADLYPRYSPDGRTIAFRRGGNPTSDIYLLPAAGGSITRLTQVRATISGFDWLPDGSGLVFSSDHEGKQELYSITLSDRVIKPLGLTDASSPDIASRDWHMTYQMENWQSSLAEVPLRDGGTARLLAPSSGRDRRAAVTPDGQRIVFVSDRDGSMQLWSLDRATGRTERLTQHRGAQVDAPTMSPDGRRMLYVTRSRGRHELWEYRFEDESQQRIQVTPASMRNAIYARDGRSVWYVSWQGTHWALYRCARNPDGQCASTETALSALRVERGRVDGMDALLLSSPQTDGQLEIVAESNLRPLRRMPLPIGGVWTAVDDAIWYLRLPESGEADVSTLRAVSLRDGTTRTIASFPRLRPLGYTPFVVMPDRKSIILPTVTANSTDIAFARLVKPRGAP